MSIKSINIGSESYFEPIQGDVEHLDSKTFWSINKEEAELNTSTNIVGYYRRMVKSYLSSFDEYKDVLVKPYLNKNFDEDFSGPVVVIERGNMTPSNIGVMNVSRIEQCDVFSQSAFEEKFPDANYYESELRSELINMGISIFVYGVSVAEVEKLSVLIYNLIHATSYDVMSSTFAFIVAVNPPMVSKIDVEERHSEIYRCEIGWSVEYKDDAILLIRKNVIKYATIMLREQDEDRTLTESSQNNK